MMAGVVPLNRHLGIEIAELGARHVVATLPEAPHLLNHVGKQHAAALFAVAEAASGAAVVGALADIVTTVTPLARSAQITYLKPARGPITASARLDCDAADMRAKLGADGKADFARGGRPDGWAGREGGAGRRGLVRTEEWVTGTPKGRAPLDSPLLLVDTTT
jgi:uncharacterized protein (TIGR00369 family)